jgi:hypothetical protein
MRLSAPSGGLPGVKPGSTDAELGRMLLGDVSGDGAAALMRSADSDDEKMLPGALPADDHPRADIARPAAAAASPPPPTGPRPHEVHEQRMARLISAASQLPRDVRDLASQVRRPPPAAAPSLLDGVPPLSLDGADAPAPQ